MNAPQAVWDALAALEPLAAGVWRASWQASVVAALVLAVRYALWRRLPARWGYLLWGLVLVRLALPVTPPSRFSVFNLAPRADVGPAFVADLPAALPTEADEWAGVEHVVIDDAGASDAVVAEPVLPAPSWTQVCVGIWLVGTSLLMLRIAWATVRVHRLVRRLRRVENIDVHRQLRDAGAALGIPLTSLPPVLTGPRLASPALFGCVRPRLLVPEEVLRDFAPAELRLVFLHELAHLKRRDVLVNWLATLLSAVHWFNPAAWLVMNRLRADRELACDELVLAASGGLADERRAYGHTLLRLLESFAGGDGRSPAPLRGGVGIMEGKRDLKGRIAMIARFDATQRRRWTIATAAAAMLVLSAVALTDAVGADPTVPDEAGFTAPTTAPASQPMVFMTADGQKIIVSGERATLTADAVTVVTTTQPGAAAAAAAAAAKLAVGDRLHVTVTDLVGRGMETVAQREIGADGTIALPRGARVKADGLTTDELERAIAEDYRKRGVGSVTGVLVEREPGDEATTAPSAQEDARLAAVASRDATMRQMLRDLTTKRKALERAREQFGPHHRTVVNAEKDLELHKQYLETYALQFEGHGRETIGSTRPLGLAPLNSAAARPLEVAESVTGPVRAGERVTVSVLGLVAPDVETVKTARPDAEGRVLFPVVGNIKAVGLTPAELQEAVAKAFEQKQVMQDPLVSVSLPDRGESHQLSGRRAPSEGPVAPDDPMAAGAPPAALRTFRRGDDAFRAAVIEKRLPEVKFDGAGLSEAIDFIRDASNANVFVDWRALEAAGVDRATPVSVQLNDVRVGEALELILRDHDVPLAYEVRNGTIVITTADRGADGYAKVKTKTYDVSALVSVRSAPVEAVRELGKERDDAAQRLEEAQSKLGPNHPDVVAARRKLAHAERALDAAYVAQPDQPDAGKMTALINVITGTIVPDTWRSAGGTVGNVAAFGSKLVVTTTEPVHAEVAELLAMLRDEAAHGGGNAGATAPATTRTVEH